MNLINVENMFLVPKNLLLHVCSQIFIWGGCDSGGSSTNGKVGGSIPGYSSLHGKVSLGNLLNPQLPLIYPSDCGTYIVCVYSE